MKGSDGHLSSAPLNEQIETGKKYAVKVISKKLMEGKEHMIRNEINVLRRISVGHANILTMADSFETLNNCKLGRGGDRTPCSLTANVCFNKARLISQCIILFLGCPCSVSGDGAGGRRRAV
jgi:serine/threonine protein kinase